MSEIKGKNILITGGASGIGRLLARECAQEGAKTIVIWDINSNQFSSIQNDTAFKDVNLILQECDVSDFHSVRNLSNGLLEKLNSIDILFNNAGVVSGNTLLESSEKDIINTFKVNVFSHFWTIKAFLPSMIQNGSGHIVTISSAAGLIGVYRLADYSASKFAAFGLDESLRMEIHRMKWNIKTTVVCPYYIDTGMFAGVKTRFPFLLPILKPEKVVHKIIRSIKKDKKRVYMPWLVYTVPLLRTLPVSVFDWIANFFGINHSMNDFVGRKMEQLEK